MFWSKFIALIIVSGAIQINIKAQDDKRFTVESGSSIADVLSFSEMFQYPQFMPGMVYYKDGTSKNEIVNYNIVIGEMLFINSRDTLVISNSAAISHIKVAEDLFYLIDGCEEKLAGDYKIMLLSKRYVKLLDIKKEGAYGTSNSTAAIDNYTSYNAANNTSTYKMKAAQDIVYSFKNDFYFSNSPGSIVIAKESNIIKMFPDKKDAIKQYLKEQKISFNNKEDMIKLTGFLQEL